MSNLTIGKDLSPGDKVTFRIKSEFYGRVVSSDLKFIVPEACHLISKVDNIFYTKKIVATKKIDPTVFNVVNYAKGGAIGSSHYRLKLTLETSKNVNDLNPSESKVRLDSGPSGKLAQLDYDTCSQVFQIIPVPGNSNKKIIHLKVPNSLQPTTASGSVVNTTLNEIIKTVKVQEFTVSVPSTIHKNLISKKPPGAPKKGAVEDLVIYAYKRYDKDDDASIKKKLMYNEDLIDESTPPDHSLALNYRLKNSYSKTFDINNEKNIEFYISIARYSYNGTAWVGDWLQKNNSGNTIWKRAAKR